MYSKVKFTVWLKIYNNFRLLRYVDNKSVSLEWQLANLPSLTFPSKYFKEHKTKWQTIMNYECL